MARRRGLDRLLFATAPALYGAVWLCAGIVLAGYTWIAPGVLIAAILLFTLALIVILFGVSAYTGHSPREYILQM